MTSSAKDLVGFPKGSQSKSTSDDLDMLGDWLSSCAKRSLLPLMQRNESDIAIHPLEQSHGIFSEFWCTSILVSGSEFSLKFLVYFRTNKIKKVLSEKIVSRIQKERFSDFVVDFMKEYCNHTGGFIKSELEKFSIASSISIPIRCRALDMVFSESERLSSIQNFKLEVGPDSGFHCQFQMKFGSNFLKEMEPVLNGIENKESSDEIEIELF